MSESSPVRDENADSLIGLTLDHGRYEIVKLIGEGGMGRVFQARQISMNRMVALKLLRAQLAADASLLARFEQEALSVSRLRHPNTITVYDYGRTEDGYLFIAMELLGGRPLAQVLREEGRLGLPRALHIMAQVVGAVAEAHQLGVVHRDLKPENIQLDQVASDPDFAKVLDFGIAKIIHGEEENDPRHKTLTMAGAVFGTPHYMSPEQVHGLKVDHRTDIYALGVILYELLAGRPPFEGSTPMAVMMAQASKAPPDIRESHPDLKVIDTVADLINACLVKDRDKRLGSTAEMLDILRQAQFEVGERSMSFGGTRLGMEAGAAALRRRSSGVSPLPKAPDAEPPKQAETVAGVVGPLALEAPVGRIHETATAGEAFRPGSGELDMLGRPRRRWPLALAVVLVAAGAAVWFALRGGPPPEVGTDTPAVPSADPVRIEVSGGAAAIRYRIVSTPAGAQVLEAGKPLGPTPFERSWPTGERPELTLQLDGYLPEPVTLPGAGDPEQTLEVALRKVPEPKAWLHLSSTPPGAEVYLADKLVGTTPFDWRPAPTTDAVELRFSKKGFDDVQRKVALAAGDEPVPVDVELAPAHGAPPRPHPPAPAHPAPPRPPTPASAPRPVEAQTPPAKPPADQGKKPEKDSPYQKL